MDEVDQAKQDSQPVAEAEASATLPPLQLREVSRGLNGTVECDVFDEPLQEWIPYTAVPGDQAPYALAIFAYLEANGIVIADLEESPRVLIRKKAEERQWRDNELSRADTIVNKIEDFEIDADVKPWRQYRVALRKWPEQPEFPDAAARPKAPDFGNPIG